MKRLRNVLVVVAVLSWLTVFAPKQAFPWNQCTYGTASVTGYAITTVNLNNIKEVWVQNYTASTVAQMSINDCGAATIANWIAVGGATMNPIVIQPTDSGKIKLEFKGATTADTCTMKYWYFQN